MNIKSSREEIHKPFAATYILWVVNGNISVFSSQQSDACNIHSLFVYLCIFSFLRFSEKVAVGSHKLFYMNNLDLWFPNSLLPITDTQQWKHNCPPALPVELMLDYTDSRCSNDSPSTVMTPSRCSILTAPQHSRMMAMVCKLFSLCCSLSILMTSFFPLAPRSFGSSTLLLFLYLLDFYNAKICKHILNF